MFWNKKLRKEVEELKVIVENYRQASQLSNEKGVKYVPADEKQSVDAGMFLPISEKMKIDLQEQEEIKKVTER